MNKRVYLAAPWVDREKMFERVLPFEEAGFEITHKWWQFEGSGYSAPDEALRKQAQDDVNGVATADVVVVFNTAKSEGKAVEQGLAIAFCIPIIGIGDRRNDGTFNVFHWLPRYTWVPDIAAAIEVVKNV